MASLTIVQGTVKYAAGPARETKNGPRINVVVTLADGEETKLWGDSDLAAFSISLVR
jgi:hypothetical protein